MQITSAPRSFFKPTLQEWNELIQPAPGEGDQVVLGRRAEEPLPASMAEVRRKVKELDFHPLDPFVATVAAAIGADQIELPKGVEKVHQVAVPNFYADEVEVLLATPHGPGAPMLVILPGIHGNGDGSHCKVFKKLALERGMNYVVLPNSMSPAMLEDQPLYHPGNPRVDALWSHDLLKALRQEQPEFFSKLAVAGYSYGALQGANLVRLDEENRERLIEGSLVAISPPENLEHSMVQLDDLRKVYQGNWGTIADTGVRYKNSVRSLGYARFMESSLAKRGPGTNLDEVEISDKYGSRDSLKSLVEVVDTQFGHNRLPKNTQEYQEAGWWERHKMRQRHDQQVENMTYIELAADWMSKDRWLVQQGMTTSELARRYSFSEAMKAIEKTPVMVLASADDYILNAQDVESFRKLEAKPGKLEVARVFEPGGHVGLDWNPAIAETVIDFAMAPFQKETFIVQG